MSFQQEEELQIRDLLLKLKVLTYGLIEERKRSEEFLSKIRDYEQSLKQKESENVVLTKENIDLQSKLLLERSKKTPNKKITTNVISELEEKTNKQEEKIKSLKQRLMEKEESFDQQNIKHQTMMVIKEEEISKLKEKIKKLEENPGKSSENGEKIAELTKKYNLEKDGRRRKEKNRRRIR